MSTAPPYMAIMKRIWVQALSVWFVFFITLTNFPAIQYRVKPQKDSVKAFWKLCTPKTYLLFKEVDPAVPHRFLLY